MAMGRLKAPPHGGCHLSPTAGEEEVLGWDQGQPHPVARWPLSLSTMAPEAFLAGACRDTEADMQTLRREAARPYVPLGTLETDFPAPLYR